MAGLGAAIFARTAHKVLAEPSTPTPSPTKTYLPIVSNTTPPPKAGLAASSHDNILERIALLGGVAAIRGWQLGGEVPSTIGATPYVPCWWCDTYTRAAPNEPIQVVSQLHVPDLLVGSEGELLFLNEPDLSLYGHHGQCEASPRKAAVLYAHAKERLPHMRFIGAGVSHLDYINGFQWLRAWIGEVIALTGNVPQMWAWDIHHYIPDGNPLEPINALCAVLSEFGVESPRIYVSEWAACTAERVRETRIAFDTDPRIVRHFYYDQTYAWWDGDGRCTMLFEQEGEPRLSELGQAWVEAGMG